jgi:hypothetical protein
MGIFSITEVKPRQFLKMKDGELRSETQLKIENSGPAVSSFSVEVTVEGKPAVSYGDIHLGNGNNKVKVYAPELDTDDWEEKVTVHYKLYDSNRTLQADFKASQTKVRKWKLHIVHNSHIDIGFTSSQMHLKKEQWPKIIDKAIDEINKTKKKEIIANKYRYILESSYMMYDSAWRYKKIDWINKFRDHLSNGRLAYSSSVFNIVNEMMCGEELARFYYYSKRFMKDFFGYGPDRAAYHTDDPGFSWALVDAAVEAGVRYYIQRLNPSEQYIAWDTDRYPRLYYILNRKGDKKLMLWDQKEWYYQGNWDMPNTPFNLEQFPCLPEMNQTEKFDVEYNPINDDEIAEFLTRGFDKLLEETVPYKFEDFLIDFTCCTDRPDNRPTDCKIKDNVKSINAFLAEYESPRMFYSSPGEFMQDVESRHGEEIPAYKGTREDYWNFGAASCAYETGINRENHGKLPAAEFLATIASVLDDKQLYPYENIARAYLNMLLYDEHTWNIDRCTLQATWIMKRNAALGCSVLADKVLNDSTGTINNLISVGSDKTIIVYNNSSWIRDDVVQIDLACLKVKGDFVIRDGDSRDRIDYQKIETQDGKNLITFIAEGVPANGYKCFIVESDTPATHEPSVIYEDGTLKNKFYKITFDNIGSIISIKDRQNFNKELVDQSAKHKMNQFLYYTTLLPVAYETDADSPSEITKAICTGESGPVMGHFNALTLMKDKDNSLGIRKIERRVILYNNIKRIDIINKVYKNEPYFDNYPAQCGNSTHDEEGFFVFPFTSENFQIHHEMPSGEVIPHEEQFLSSCEAHYTVNRWVDIFSVTRNNGISFCPVNVPLVQYGKRKSCFWNGMPYSRKLNPAHKKYDEKDYTIDNPGIYSFVFNNKWKMNFPLTQKGCVILKYSIGTYQAASWDQGTSRRLGYETAEPFNVSILEQKNSGILSEKSRSLISIDKKNVVLTTAKLAETNGEGVILRFNETAGEKSRVTVGLDLFCPDSWNLTDLVENNDFAQSARVTVSSQLQDENKQKGYFGPYMAIDGFEGDMREDAREWRSDGEQTPWIRLEWESPVCIARVSLYDTRDKKGNILAGELRFSDDSMELVGDLSKSDSNTICFTAKTVSWIEFRVTQGKGTNVGLSCIQAHSAQFECTDSTIRFEIDANGWRIIRLIKGEAPPPVNGVKAEIAKEGTQITWNAQPGAVCYEIFRRTAGSNYMGVAGCYIGSSSKVIDGKGYFFDSQLDLDTENKTGYLYCVRAVKTGRKGKIEKAEWINPVQVSSDDKAVAENSVVTPPKIVKCERLHDDKISLSWEPAVGPKEIREYEIYRNDVKMNFKSCYQFEANPVSTGDLLSILDVQDVNRFEEYTYTVKAISVDDSPAGTSNPVTVRPIYWEL